MSEPQQQSLERGEALNVKVMQGRDWTAEVLIWVDSAGRVQVEIKDSRGEWWKRLVVQWWCGTATVFNYFGFGWQRNGFVPARQ